MPPQLNATTGFMVTRNVLELIKLDPSYNQLNKVLRATVDQVITDTGGASKGIPEAEQTEVSGYMKHHNIREPVPA